VYIESKEFQKEQRHIENECDIFFKETYVLKEKKKQLMKQGTLVAHICNPSYLGG
jgi:hypothetical protein